MMKSSKNLNVRICCAPIQWLVFLCCAGIFNVSAQEGDVNPENELLAVINAELSQPLPAVTAELLSSGNCARRSCDPPGSLSLANLPTVQNLKVEGYEINKQMVKHHKISWDAPQSAYGLSNNTVDFYELFINKNNSTYEVYRVEPTTGADGEMISRSSVLITAEPGLYAVQVRVAYAGNNLGSVQYSPWNNAGKYRTVSPDQTVADLISTNARLYSCLINNGYVPATLLNSILSVSCPSYRLKDADINQLPLMTALRALDISDNRLVNDITALQSLSHLSLLNLSDNPQLAQDISALTLHEVETIVLSNMNFNAVPILPPVATFIDLSGNDITSGYSNIRSDGPAIAHLNLSDNPLVNGGLSFTELNGRRISSLALENSGLTQLQDLSGIIGLANLYADGSALAANQDLTAFGGFCRLSLKNTDVLETLNGQVPIQMLWLQDNAKLKYVAPLTSRRFMPVQTWLKGSNALTCSHHQQIESLAALEFNGQSYTPPGQDSIQCPATSIFSIKQNADHCKPDALASVEVYEDEATARRFVKWQEGSAKDYQNWGVNGYQISQLNNQDEVLSRRFVPLDFVQPYVTLQDQADKYAVSACTDYQCGYEVMDSDFEQGLSQPINAQVNWLDLQGNSKEFYFTFEYPEELLSSANPIVVGEPTEFRIISNFEQANGEYLVQTIQRLPGNTVHNWQSLLMNYDNIIGNSFKIVACHPQLACGAAAEVYVNTPVVSQSLPVPQWELGESPVLINHGTEMILDWSLSGPGVTNVDYIEVTERQPQVSVNAGFLPAINTFNQSRHHRTYYIDDIQGPLKLERQAWGPYEFELKACHRDRVNGDVCSISSGRPFAHHNPHYDLFIKRLELQAPSTDFDVFESVGWFNDSDGTGLRWSYNGNNGYKPDYFYVSSSTATSCESTSFTINYADHLQENNERVWTSKIICEDLGASEWEVKSCVHGAGCAAMTTIDTQDPSQGLSAPPDPTRTAVVGGPGDFLPGMWWHPELSGTGWHFYWASELRHFSNNPQYGRTYDLIGYWFAYREIHGVWTPVWFEARLKQVLGDPGNGAAGFFEGDIFYHQNTSNGYEKIDAGNLQLLFGGPSNNNNRRATMLIDADYDGGLFTAVTDAQDLGPYNTTDVDGQLRLEIEDFAISIIGNNPNSRFGNGNDADHYSGLWQYNFNEDGRAEVSVLTWIERGLEVSTFALFDSEGVPIWMQAVTCDGQHCARPRGNYFDEYKKSGTYSVGMIPNGFNPLGARPLEFAFDNPEMGFVEYVGNAGRCFDEVVLETERPDKRFRQGRFWLDIERNISYALADGSTYTRQINHHNYALDPVTVCSGSMLPFEKRASLHDIRYFVNENPESLTVCNPNNTAGSGQCEVSFTWYTDDDFLSIEPQYSLNGSEFAPLSNLCPGVPLDRYVTTEFECVISEPGEYVFQLHKDSYATGSDTVVIAESRPLSILECASPHCSSTVGAPAEPPMPEDFISTLAPDPLNDVVGVTSGAFDVTESGSASYAVPIFAPAGVGGVQPQLSLNYNSMGGNGIAGVGWDIAGVSSISRCLRSKEHDPDLDFYPPIQLNNEDALCLDGMRLLLDTGANGQNGSTYRTEIETFSKIEIISATANGPETFRIYDRNGDIRTYGSADNAFKANNIFTNGTGAQVLSDDGTVVSWLLNKIEDRNGNSIWFLWDTFEGENYLSYVRWNNPESGNHYYEIAFDYSSGVREDAQHHYGVGTEYKLYKKLEEITTSIRAATGVFQDVRTLRLQYDLNQGQPTAASGRYRLHSITECSGTVCLNPIEFEWDNNINFSGVGQTVLATSHLAGLTGLGNGGGKFIDINGDGNKEFMFVNNYDDGDLIFEDLEARFYIIYSRLNGIDTGQMTCEDYNGLEIYWKKICDMGLEPFDFEESPVTFSDSSWHIYDFNGDGYEDILSTITDPEGITGLTDNRWYIFYSNGSRICKNTTDAANCRAPLNTQIEVSLVTDEEGELLQRSYLFDLDGDGLPELIQGSENASIANLSIHSLKKNAAGDLEFQDTTLLNFEMAEMYHDAAFCNAATGLDFCTTGVPGFEFLFDEIEILDISPAPVDSNGDTYGDLMLTYNYTKKEGASCLGKDRCETAQLTAVFSKAQDGANDYYKRMSFIGLQVMGGVLAPNDDVNGRSISNVANKSIRAIDINGDGLSDFVYRKKFGKNGLKDEIEWYYQLNLGVVDGRVVLGDPSHFNLEDVAETNTNPDPKPGTEPVDTEDEHARKFAIHFFDYEGDGDVDVLYAQNPSEVTSGPVKYLLRRYDVDSPYNTVENNHLTVTSGNFSVKDNVYLLDDINGDGKPDYFRIARYFSDKGSEKWQEVVPGAFPWKTIDKITAFKTEMGRLNSDIEVDYESATLPSVYTRSVGSLTSVNQNPHDDDSMIFDLIMPEYLVRRVSRPSGLENEATRTAVYYHYEGLKVQAGGRGALGFSSVSTYDIEHTMKTVTDYAQTFPLIGMPEKTTTIAFNAFTVTASEANAFSCYTNVCPAVLDVDPCDTNMGGDACVDPIEFVGAVQRVISESHNQYDVKSDFQRGSSNENAWTFFPYVARAIEKSYDIKTGAALKVLINDFSYHEPANAFFGNLTNNSAMTCPGDTAIPAVGQSTYAVCTTLNGTMIERKIVQNTFADNRPEFKNQWMLGRLESSEITNTRKAGDAYESLDRSTNYRYSTENGQLLLEKINGDINTGLKTMYVYDDHGQTTATYQCSNHLNETQCLADPVAGRPIDGRFIHRVNKTFYDRNRPEYVGFTQTPYTTGYQTVSSMDFNQIEAENFQLSSQHVGRVVLVNGGSILQRDIYGNVERSEDLYGTLSRTVYGVFGEGHATATETGGLMRTTRRWCEGAGAPYYCPPHAAMVVVTTAVGTPTQRVYSDVLGREVRSQVESFERGQWQTTDTFYDKAGRTIRQTEPFLLENNILIGPKHFTTTTYDKLDRVLTITSPHHCVEDNAAAYPNTRCESDQLVKTTTTYTNLSVSTENANGQVTTQDFDETGKITRSTDAMGLFVDYSYDANGNLVRTSGPSGNIDIQYDAWDRKISMQDPDKGSWSYAYNAVGELIEQTDAKNQVVENYYDIRGRMFFRKSSGVRSFWEYDLGGGNNYGQLVNEYGRGELNTRGYAKTMRYYYDMFGRPIELETIVYYGFNGEADIQVYNNHTTYDQYGRVFQTFDATGEGVLHQYNDSGYQYIIRDAADGVGGQVYYQTMATNARGQVVHERHHGQINTYKSYHDHNGFLDSILTEAADGTVVQDQSFAFDKIGNLIRRSDLILTHDSALSGQIQTETFEYDVLNRLLTEDYNYGEDIRNYIYEPNGNLRSKDGLILNYDGSKPHAVSSTNTGNTYSYDANGNMHTRTDGINTLDIDYTSFDKPERMSAVLDGVAQTSEIAYDASRNRYLRLDTSSDDISKLTFYVGSVELILRENTEDIEFKRYIGNLVIDGTLGNGNRNLWDHNYLLKDHIGSTHVVVNKQGQVKNNMSFSAWGERRKPPAPSTTDIFSIYPIFGTGNVWSQLQSDIEDTTNRGFTGHEHFDRLGIIHMNGRIYDPGIGRFLQADPIIQDPYATQSLNRYSYVMNNPLSYTDPTGYRRLRSGWWRMPVALGISATAGGILAGKLFKHTAIAAFAQANGLLFSAISGAISGGIQTGNFKGAVRGGIQSSVTFVIGHGISGDKPLFTGEHSRIKTAVAHAFVSGVSSEVDGGKFGHGFASALLSQGAHEIGLTTVDNVMGNILMNALVQGGISEATGGKFVNGAMSAAFRVAFNDAAEKVSDMQETTVEVMDGSHSFFRGIYRFSRHTSRLVGGHGMGEQIQASLVEEMLFGEALGLVLQVNGKIIGKGAEVANDNIPKLLGRQATSLGLGMLKGGTAGPSLGLLAGMGDVYYNIEKVALEHQIFITTVDANIPILPQLPELERQRVSEKLEFIVDHFLLGGR